MANKENISAVLAAIAAEKGRYRQTNFYGYEEELADNVYARTFGELKDCGTSACIAGFTLMLFEDSDTTPFDLVPEGKRGSESVDHITYYMSQRATEILGLTSAQGELIFYCFDDARALKMLKYVANHSGAEPKELMKATGRMPDAWQCVISDLNGRSGSK
jgi:hypothetical protein